MKKIIILGSYISSLSSYEESFNEIIGFLQQNSRPAYITVNNVHTVIEGILHPVYQKITNQAFLSLPDGRPLSIVARLKGDESISRIFGPTFFEKTLDWGRRFDLKHFFFGSTPEVLEKLKRTVKQRFPDVKIVGSISPPFKALTENENYEYLKLMNNSGADIIWVALGAPKQECWIYDNYRKLNRGVMIGIGAGFDYLAGNTRHAPQWMKNFALEWLYRLIQEPRRLWKRYLVTNTLFVLFVVMELLGVYIGPINYETTKKWRNKRK